MTPDRELIEQIGELLWSIFPPEAKVIVYKGMFYPTFHECGTNWYDGEDNRLGPGFGDERTSEVNRELAALAVKLRSTPPYAREPFTHMHYTLDEDRKADIKFAYIPEWDSWTGIYMKGVSDIPEEEAKPRGNFYRKWLVCKARREKEPY